MNYQPTRIQNSPFKIQAQRPSTQATFRAFRVFRGQNWSVKMEYQPRFIQHSQFNIHNSKFTIQTKRPINPRKIL